MHLTNVLRAYSCTQHSAADKVINTSESTCTSERMGGGGVREEKQRTDHAGCTRQVQKFVFSSQSRGF